MAQFLIAFVKKVAWNNLVSNVKNSPDQAIISGRMILSRTETRIRTHSLGIGEEISHLDRFHFSLRKTLFIQTTAKTCQAIGGLNLTFCIRLEEFMRSKRDLISGIIRSGFMV